MKVCIISGEHKLSLPINLSLPTLKLLKLLFLFSFSPKSSQYVNALRYAETQTMETSEGYVLEADLNLQCDDATKSVTAYDPDHELLLQYSKDEGTTWNLVQEENLPGSADEESFHPASIYHLSEFTDWATVILPMPRTTWSSNLRLRVIHNKNSNAVWALNNVYMGPACPMHCRNRGRCRNGVCQCDMNSVGPSCLSRTPLPTGVDDTFTNISNLQSKGWTVVGASVATKNKSDCGAMPSDQYLHFDKPGVRKLMTSDIDTSLGGQIQFYIRISEDGCEVPGERANGVLLQYSNNGGVTWTLLNELYYLDYTQPQYVHRAIPEEAQTKQTRFRWWQPRNTGAGHQPWSIGDVIVGEPMPMSDQASSEQTIKINGRRSSGDFPGSKLNPFILLSNDGIPSDYCDPRFDSYVFTKTNGNRFATTNDYLLHTGDTIQFEINIGCTDVFSWNSPVHLEFSHDEGYSWDLVVRSCYPDGRPRSQMPYIDPDHDLSVHDCTGSARELTEPSVYYKGDHTSWQKVVIPVPRRVAARPVRLRWWQNVPNNSSAGVSSPWAIRSIYIGPSCPAYCNGHGRCEMGHTCVCDRGYSGDHCQDIDSPQAGFWDHLTEGPNSDWWGNIIGVTVGAGCGEVHEGGALYFASEGTRKAETVSLDTLSIRMIQFYIQIGNSEDSDTCSLPEERDEAVMLQYSNDNGITWKLIKELSFDSYSDISKRVIAKIPFAAKTPSTSFRWWQPLRDNSEGRSQWSLDDVFIGGPDLLSAGFADDFQTSLSEANWYRVRGGGIGNFTSCNGRVHDEKSALVISSSGGIAETWDFRLNSGSFIQFDVIMNCESETPGNDVLSLEYSTDLGRSWGPVLPSCSPASSDCEQDFGSLFFAGLHQGWTRRTLALPELLTRSPQIRFRWIQHGGTVSWAIDNLYIGNGCQWMCSGYGRCWPNGTEDTCICDEGFEDLPHCQASIPLDIDMMDTFDHPWNTSGKYRRIIGHDTETASSLMLNGESLRMGSKGIRLLETEPINTEDSQYIQFYIQFSGNAVNTSSAIVLQSSRNHGITWSTMHFLYTSSLPSSPTLVHVFLPAFARHVAVSFRLWQSSINSGNPMFENGEAVWTMDNLYIGGRVSGCNIYVLEDDFEPKSQESKHWLHDTHLTSESFCNSSGNALVVGQNVGEHVIMTRDLCVAEGYMLQFKIAVGCSSSRLDEHNVRLEYSTDHGITWNLLRDDCKGGDSESGRCNEQIYPPTVYYPGTSSGWRKITLPLSGFTCGSLRFRWYQGFYADNFKSARAVPWAIDDVYIGPQCNQMCNGHGKCSNEGEACICDLGFGGDTCCDVVEPNPTFFIETFDNEDGVGERRALTQLEIMSGGLFTKDSKTCDETGVVIHQWGYRVQGSGERILETRDLDLRDADSVQFYLTYLHESGTEKINGGSESSESAQPVTEFLHVQYSTDGGIVWRSLETIPFIAANAGELQYIALSLFEESRTNATRLRWWQPKKPIVNYYDFIIDQIVIAGPESSIDDHFDNETSYWVETSGAVIQPLIGSDCCPSAPSKGGGVCNIMEIGSDNADRRYCHSNYASTNGVKVSRGSYVSFSLAMNCLAVEDHCEGISLEYSVDFGKTWHILVPPCLPSNPECTNYYPGSVFFSDAHPQDGHNKRIIVPIPDAAYSSSTRFRWIQTSSTPESWYLDDVYIGNECPGACLGHGSCHQGKCKCDDGWTGFICQTATEDTAKELKDTFNIEAGDSGLFSRIVGGEIDTVCGEIGFGDALRFYKSCSRILETITLNTTKADFVQFKFRTGCGASLPADRNEGVLVDYTTNGGAVWHNLAELYYANHHEKPSFVNILLPAEAKTTGTKFRWWQPKHSGLNQSDWALDNILIGGKREEMMLSDDFNVKEGIGAAGLWLDRGEKQMWEFYDNTQPDSFCGRDNIILAGKVPGLDVTISTKDFIPEEGFMIQYTIVVLCEDVQKHHQPVHVQYSTDFGDTWQYIVSQCVPSDRNCFGKEVTQPSAHFISPDWRRKTIWIPSFLYGQPVRFRFHQEESDVQWALDRLFIGPACPDACSGHGDCVGVPQDDMFRSGDVDYDVRRCLCDLGYEGPNCYLDFDRNKKFLKDDFNAGEIIGNWFIIEPLNTDTRCGLVVDASSLAFSGVGPRQAETEELDLRDARFAQHNVIIGGTAQNCLASKQRNDGLLMQYSVDGGITWEMLHDLDYESYQNATHDYISLPLKARTNATRLRWWQPFEIDEVTGLAVMGEDRAGWAIDNIYIGGQEVNAFTLEDDFEVGFDAVGNTGSIDERLYEFYPNGDLGEDQCPGDDTVHMMWPGTSAMYPKQSLTTRQLIVTPGHMIQFKIKVGCTDKVTCSPEFPVRLEFREDPRYDDSWTLVKPACYPASPPSHLCYPYVFHHPSTYKLEYQNTWKRITLPLDYISSDSAQFRWIQSDGAPKLYSWAIDELYIGESCRNFCSGHGKCTSSLECICDDGFIGEDCSQPLRRYVLPVFLETFESESINARMWSNLSGGKITSEGCGPLRHGFSKSVYFYDCGERQLVTREMDLSKAWQIQYVLQFGSFENKKECRVYQGELYDETITSTIILQYTTNNGITWNTLRNHWPSQYGIARRLTQPLPSLAKTKTTMLRWWQPTHHGEGYDQWALDNVAIIMTRRQRHLHLLDHERQWRKYGGRQPQLWNPLQTVMNIKSNIRERRPIEYEPEPPEESGLVWS